MFYIIANYKIEKYDQQDKLITIDWEPTFLGKLLFCKPYTFQYVGYRLVFYTYPYGSRCGLTQEETISELLRKEKYREHLAKRVKETLS